MDDRQHAAEVAKALRATTISYPEWVRRKTQGRYKDVSMTQWWKAFDSLDRIGGVIVPPSLFGASLAAEAPRIGVSAGATTPVSSLSGLTSAMGSVSAGSRILVSANLTGGGATYSFSRNAAAGAPITVEFAPGYSMSGFAEVNISGSYLRFLNLENKNGHSIKIDGDYIEIDQSTLHDNSGFGVLFGAGSTPSNIQIWNTKMYTNGSYQNYDHNIYTAYTGGICVIANCLFYNAWAYNCQLYPSAANLIMTCCTVDGGQQHYDGRGDERGGIVIAGSGTVNPRLYGIISTNAPGAAGYHIGAGSDTPTNVQVFDSLAFGNAGGASEAGATYTPAVQNADPLYVNRAAADFRLQSGSPAIGKVLAARYGYVPATDIKGNVRVTADAGCYAKEALAA